MTHQQNTAPYPCLVFPPDPTWNVPDAASCAALWDKYAMPEHIRAHSRVVAGIAVTLAERAVELGANVHVPSVLAAGLLHDLGKYYAIRFSGSHAQLGGAWVLAETRNPHIAHGVIHHVRWPWEINTDEDHWLLTYCIIYADKRVMHDTAVGMKERFDDLYVRYGVSEAAKQRIALSYEQGLTIEAALERRLRMDLHACTFDSGRMV